MTTKYHGMAIGDIVEDKTNLIRWVVRHFEPGFRLVALQREDTDLPFFRTRPENLQVITEFAERTCPACGHRFGDHNDGSFEATLRRNDFDFCTGCGLCDGRSSMAYRQLGEIINSRPHGIQPAGEIGIPIFTSPAIDQPMIVSRDLTIKAPEPSEWFPMKHEPTPIKFSLEETLREVFGPLFTTRKKEIPMASIKAQLQAQIDRASARLAELDRFPATEDYPIGTLIGFDRKSPRSNGEEQTYHYAGVKTDKGWFITGREYRPWAWDELMQWLAEDGGTCTALVVCSEVEELIEPTDDGEAYEDVNTQDGEES